MARLYCRLVMRQRYNKSDMVVVPTSLMELLLNLYFVEKPITVIPTGIEKADFHLNGDFENNRLLLLEQYQQLKDKKLLFTAGRLGKEKEY